MAKVALGKDQKLLVDSFYKVRTKKDLALFIEDLFIEEETAKFLLSNFWLNLSTSMTYVHIATFCANTKFGGFFIS